MTALAELCEAPGLEAYLADLEDRLDHAVGTYRGIVSEVVPAAELSARTAEHAARFAAMPTRAVWETKRLLDAAETATLEQQLEAGALTQAALVETADFEEGVAAFLDKRTAQFRGR